MGMPMDSDRGRIPPENDPGMSAADFMAQFQDAIVLKAAELDLRRQEQIKLQQQALDRVTGSTDWSLDQERHTLTEQLATANAQNAAVKERVVDILSAMARTDLWHTVAVKERIDQLCILLDLHPIDIYTQAQYKPRKRYSLGPKV